MAVELVAARQRIIERPRLTSILDESRARIRLLIAPAGYGKTTLARQWLAPPGRHDVWYRGGPASADVAALAAGLAEAASEVIPEAGKRMRDRLRATGNPEEDVDILAELFAEDVQGWPADAWLAIDDYHFAIESAASERFVDLLTQQTPVQMLITSRRRPTWATARRILYGELLEIERRALAMQDGEARELLGRVDAVSDELIIRARGWPAVLGLAAIKEDFILPAEDLPTTLHTYFAEEILHAVQPEAGRALAALAIAPVVTPQLAAEILGANAPATIALGLRLGVLTDQGPEAYLMHPLLRGFLNNTFANQLDQPTHALLIARHFLDREEWDFAFEVASPASLRPVLAEVIERGLDPMLSDGRLATLQRWIEVALRAHLDLPIVDLAEAEVAFRQAEHARAYVLASQAAATLTEPALVARAHARAGHSALMSSRERAALDHFRSAVFVARTWESRREALVGLYFAASELGAADAKSAFKELEAALETTPDGILRREVLRLTHATRTRGGIGRTIDSALPKLYLLDRATDPLGATGFLHALTTSLNLAARYADALDLANRQLELASRHRLHLPVVHAHLNQAISHLGLGRFAAAAEDLARVEEQFRGASDAYLEATVRAISCRLLVAQHRFSDAVSATDDEGATITSPPLRAEYLGSRALALACGGDVSAALALLNQARDAFPSSIEVHVLGPCVEAVAALAQDEEARRKTARNAWDAATENSNFDSFVCAFRAQPALLDGLAGVDEIRVELGVLLGRIGEINLARRLNLPIPRPKYAKRTPLTPRELEVLGELKQGSSNRDIARRLFISESTVKAHLRHIYEKLGVRTRAELLARTTTRR